jgi:PAS domain S-box-containing protein
MSDRASRESGDAAGALRRCADKLARAMTDLHQESESHRLARVQFRDLYSELEAVMDTSMAGIILSQRKEITRINQAAADMLGRRVEDLVGEDFVEVLALDTADAPDACYRRLLSGECIEQRECVLKGPRGEERVLQVSARMIDLEFPGRGEVWAFMDITKEVEAQRLREEVDRITRHDLKAPLQAILGAPELLAMEGELTQPQQKLVRLIEDAAADMLDMINLSLDLYKMESGRYEVRPDSVDVMRLLRRIARELGPLLQARAVELVVDVADSTPEAEPLMARGEVLLCRSLFSNLIKNAVEAAPEDSTVTVQAGRRGNNVAVDIHNLGGVPEGIRDRFFEKYVTAGKEQGSGLGTYSALLIAQTLGGSVALDSLPEETSIRVTLPAAQGGEG